ncbi:MAG TPA: FG-GAP and VCBS repeat-containing protein [Luteitalea sp.]|nr:FG-GAP and VCBS repeat-containing protein [Luteitalea sp.]
MKIVTVLTALLALASQAADAPFRATPLVTGLAMGYQVVLADLNRDKRLDVIVIDERADTISWFENPSWERHLLVSDVPRPINLDTHDLDGDGIPEIALAYRFGTNPDQSVGEVVLLTHAADAKAPWTSRPIGRVPTAHRVRWMPVERGKAPWLIVAPFAGERSYAPEYAQVAPIQAFVPGDWKPRTISTQLRGILHSVHPVEWTTGRWQLLTASFDGVHRLDPRPDGEWRHVRLHPGSPEPCPKCGTSELKVGTLGRQRFIAAIEPFHGNQVAVYLEAGGRWERTVLDDTMTNGHALAVGDLDGDGRDEIVTGFRGQGFRISAWRAADAKGGRWTRTDLDVGHVAGADCKIADVTGDRRTDVVCSGASTGNVMLIESPPRR